MVDFEYLHKGLSALARAHQVNTMAGHLGAAVIAGYFIGEQHPDLDETVCSGIEGELARVIRGESVFSPNGKSGITAKSMFEPFPQQEPNENLIDGIAEALTKNITETRQSGHNVIFAASAVRALKDHPELATPAITDGIRQLILKFNNQTPGSGYYGEGKGRINGRLLKLDNNTEPYIDLQDMATRVLTAMIEHAHEHRQGFGGLWHVINHAAGLAELARYGHRDMATKGLAGHFQHLRLWQSLPDLSDELGQRELGDHDPRSKVYWQTPDQLERGHALLTHRVKTIYGFDALVDLVEDRELRGKANRQLRYLM